MNPRLIHCTLLSAACAVFFSAPLCALDAADGVAAPPIVRGYVSGLAVDAAGNRYVTGSFYEAQDFNPGVGADVKSPAGWSDLFVTRFNADGSYAWTQTVGVDQASTVGAGIAESNGTLYVTGVQYVFAASPDPMTSAAGFFQQPTTSALVVALEAATGDLKKDFGTGGTALYTGTSGASGLAIAVSGGVVYATGVSYPDYSILYFVATPYYSKTFVWALDAATGSGVAGFGESGAVILNGVPGENAGRSITVAGGSVYVGGSLYDYGFPPIWATPLAGVKRCTTTGGPAVASGTSGVKSGATNSPPFYWNYTRNAFIASLDAVTGALNVEFGASGIKQHGGLNSVTGSGLAVGNGTVYLTGTTSPAPDFNILNGAPNTNMMMPFYLPVDSDAYVLAVDAKTGVESSTFGTAGVQFFGRQFQDDGVAVAVDGGTVYITGEYGNRTISGGYYYPLAMDGTTNGGVMPSAGGMNQLARKGRSSKNAPPTQINGSAPGSSAPNVGDIVNSFGILNNVKGAPVDGTGNLWPIRFGGFGVTDAFVLALDATTGARQTSFSGDGLQTFGGSGADGGVAIAVANGNVTIAGYTFSTDAGIGGLGDIDATGWYSFLLTLDTATGGGGGAEVNTAPIVRAGDAQTAKIPEKARTDFFNGFQTWLYPLIVDDGLPNPPGAVTILWEKVSGPGDVTFDDATQAFTAVKFSAEGTYILRVTASDGELSGSDTTTVTVAQNHAPAIDSAPSATPAPAQTGADISFTASAHDPDGDELFYFWEFGDDDYGFDAATTHAYLAPGNYTVVLHVDDGVDEIVSSINVEVTGDPIFEIDDLQFCVDFKGKKRSGMKLTGTVGGLSKKFDPKGLQVTMNAGGATASFTLDHSGKSKTSQGTFALKRKKDGWSFSAKLNRTAIDKGTDPTTGAPMNVLGLSDGSADKVPASVPVSLNVGALSFSGNKNVVYSTKNGLARGK